MLGDKYQSDALTYMFTTITLKYPNYFLWFATDFIYVWGAYFLKSLDQWLTKLFSGTNFFYDFPIFSTFLRAQEYTIIKRVYIFVIII